MKQRSVGTTEVTCACNGQTKNTIIAYGFVIITSGHINTALCSALVANAERKTPTTMYVGRLV